MESASTRSGSRSSLFVYDPVHQGHHAEYLVHLLRYLRDRATGTTATFVVHPEFLRRNPGVVDGARATGRIRFEEDEVRRSSEEDSATRIAIRSFREWNAVEAAARESGADHCLLMELNPLQLALAVPGRGRLPFQVHGILFHPYTRFQPTGSAGQRVLGAVTRARKRWVLKRVARNPAVGSIFVLNDRKSVERLNHELAEGRPFACLPDPVPPRAGDSDDVPAPGEDSGGSRTVVVTPGAIRRNKGVLQALDALLRLDSEPAREVTYRMPGRIEDGLRDELADRVERVRSERPETQIRLEDRFLSDEEFGAAIARADVVLVPYQRTEGSSGLLGHAAREGTPVVGPDTGLVGSLIEEYGLGLTADTTDPGDLGRILALAVREAGRMRDTPGMRRYVRERTPERFAETIMERVRGSGLTGRDEAS